jgi:uncharacterized protein (DUF885 family)
VRTLIATAAVVLLAACATRGETSEPVRLSEGAGSQPIAGETETRRLNAWFQAVEEDDLARSPMTKTYRNIVDEDYGRWNDPSDAFDVETFELGEARLAYMRRNFDFDALEPSAQLSWRLFEYGQETARRNFPYRRHQYAFHQMRGPHTHIPVFLTTIHQINSVETARAWISRAGSVDVYLGGHIDEAEVRFAGNVHPPRWVYDRVVETARNTITGAPFDDGGENMVWSRFRDRVAALDVDERTRSELLDAGRTALLDAWVPAYERLIAVMEDHRARAGAEDGVWRLPDGPGYYAARLANFTTTNLTAAEVHELGLDNVARIHAEMRGIMQKVGYAGELQAFFEHLRTNPRFYYPNTDEGREAYLAEATRLIETITERLPEYFARLSRHDLVVRRVEPFRERSAGKAFYTRPAPDGSRPGIYYVNLYDMGDMPIYQMEALAYHEGSPGHHMQLAIMTDLDDLPPFRRFGGFTAYTEGWGLYSELLPLEMGFYQDPYSNFGRLAMELWRAARLVVDTGLHSMRWSREEAIDYLVENTPNPRGDAVRAIERYVVMPGQATAYTVGMLKILELRELAKARLGHAFEIREFHDVVLRDGAVPLSILEEQVASWLEHEEPR